MKNFVRGSGIFLRISFIDALGNPALPAAASVTISYAPKANTQTVASRVFLTYSLIAPTGGTDDWTLEWDSSVAGACVVDCHAFTIDPAMPIATADFQFRLTANRANKELMGDDDTWIGYMR